MNMIEFAYVYFLVSSMADLEAILICRQELSENEDLTLGQVLSYTLKERSATDRQRIQAAKLEEEYDAFLNKRPSWHPPFEELPCYRYPNSLALELDI